MNIDMKMWTNTASDISPQELVQCLKAVADEHRLRILRLLSGGELCVCEIHEPLGLPQNLASHHLKCLRDAGLVRTRRDGKKVIYSLDCGRLEAVNRSLSDILEGVPGWR